MLPRSLRRVLVALSTASVLATAALITSPGASVAAPMSRTDLGTIPSGTTASSTPVTGTMGTSATAATPAWLSRLNAYRSMVRAAPVSLNPALGAGAQAHAQYQLTNKVVAHSEDPALPGYTSAGNASAANSLVGSGFPSAAGFVDAWAASPFHLITMLGTDLATSAMGFASDGAGNSAAALDVYSGRTGAVATSGWPRVFPSGTTSILQLAEPSYPDSTYRCSNPTGAWYGTPILVDLGPSATVTSATATILEDGVAMPVCVETASSFSTSATAQALMKGKALVIPLRPLQVNRAYTGTVTTNAGSASVRFDTGNPASGVAGDHNGDRVADVLAVNASTQTLVFAQMGPGGVVRSRVQVGSGWGSMTWIATVPDLNGDRRSDLLARSSTGALYVYWASGHGWISGRSTIATSGWNTWNLIVNMGDITGDGRPDLITRDAMGVLYRISFTGPTTVSAPVRIGTGWGGMRFLVSVGDRSGDGVADLLAVAADGTLWRYNLTRAGTFAGGRTAVGSGWGGMNAVWSAGDVTGDGRADLMARSSTSDAIFCYPNLVTAWGVRVTSSQGGWTGMRLMS